MKPLFRFLLASAFALSLAAARAEEKNGLSVAVQKTTIENKDVRRAGYYDRIDRTQGLKASIRNMTFKEMPEGEVLWTILVNKWGYSSAVIERYSGTEKLKALKPAETVDMIVGNAEIGGYKNLSSNEKDKIEWQIIVTHEGKETIKTQSTSTFESLNKRATKPSRSSN